jgi:hypothetical protein
MFLGGILILTGYALFKNPRINVEWQTATEINTVGFNLYRAEKREGPYDKLNESIIPASNDPMRGGSYRYVDANVMPNRVYYYQLEDLDTSGVATKHEPIVVQAKAQGVYEIIGGVILVALGLVFWAQERSRRVNDAVKAEQRHGKV